RSSAGSEVGPAGPPLRPPRSGGRGSRRGRSWGRSVRGSRCRHGSRELARAAGEGGSGEPRGSPLRLGAPLARQDGKLPMSLLALADLEHGVLDPAAPVLHADDEGVLRGRSVFETLRVYGGTPFRLDAHLDRLGASAARLRLPEPPRGQVAAAGAGVG